jgi:aminoglycoside 6'-N-acetyltransferase I
MIIEEITKDNINQLTELTLELWIDCEYEKEYANYKRILKSDNENCYLIREKKKYFGFIYISIRYENVEGTTTSPVGYIEGIYIKPKFREIGAGKRLVNYGILWAKQKNCTQIASDSELTNQTSIKFHEKVGFTESNRTINFIQNI